MDCELVRISRERDSQGLSERFNSALTFQDSGAANCSAASTLIHGLIGALPEHESSYNVPSTLLSEYWALLNSAMAVK